MKLHLGCGRNIRPGWKNIDIKYGDIRCDLTKRIPLEDESAELIFHEHLLEHFEYPIEAGNFLNECYRLLKDGGAMRVSVPDTEYTIKAYVEENEKYFRECREKWHPDYCTTMMESINFHFRQAGQHKFAYDFETLKKALTTAGFRDIEKRKPLDSIVDGFDIDSRIDPGSLFVNCVKYRLP